MIRSEHEPLFPKDAAEIITVTFDFSVVAETLESASVVASSLTGLDDAAPGAIVSGPASVSGALVMQRIIAGQVGTTYALRCTAHDVDGEIHVLTAALPVITSCP